MTKIFKYRMEPGTTVGVELPLGSSVLSAGADPNGEPCIWVLIADCEQKMIRKFVTYGTGWPINKVPQKFIGRADCGAMVWHIFEVD